MRIRPDLKSEPLAHIEHPGIPAQDLAADGAHALRVPVFDDHFHEQQAEPHALEVGPDQHGEFGARKVSLGVKAHHAEHLAGGFLDGDKGHRARVVELRQTRDERMRQFFHRREEPQPDVFLADM